VYSTPLADQLSAALGDAYTIERELGGGGMSHVFVALDRRLERRVAVKVLPEYLAASVSVDRFKREVLLSAGLQHPHIVGVLNAGDAGGLPYFVMPFVEGESLGARIARGGALPIREAVSILKDVARALAYAHERGVVHRDIKPHNVLLAQGAATVTDFGVAKALSSARRSGGERGLTLTDPGTSLGTPLYMAPEQAAADPDVDHRADIYAFGVTAYEMIAGEPPFAGLTPRALLAARMTEDAPALETRRADVPAPLASLVVRCLAREPDERPQSAHELLVALDEPTMISGPVAVPQRRHGALHMLRDWRVAAAAVVVLGGVGSASMALRRPAPPVAPTLSASVPAGSSIVVLPLVSIGSDSSNAYLAAGITNELASALARMPGVRVVSPSRAAAMLASGKSPSDIGQALHVAQQLEGTVQREGKRLRVTARLVDVSDGVMRWSDMYERDATDLLTVQQELARVITGAVGGAMGTEAVAADQPAADESVSDSISWAEATAYDLYLRGRFQLAKRGAGPLRLAISYFEQAIARDPKLARAYSGLADAEGLLPLYANVPPQATLASALRNADRAIALDSTLAEVWSSRGVLHARSWRWAEAEEDFRRALTLNPSYAPARQGLGELLIVMGRLPEATRSLERAAQIEPASPVVVGSLAMALALSGRTAEAVATAERAVSYDSTLLVTQFMLGATRIYARQPAAAIAPLEAATRIDPTSFSALGMLGYAYGVTGNVDAARRTKARVEEMRGGPGADVALARIALGLGDTAEALTRLERAAKNRDPFFSTESAGSSVFAGIARSERYAALMKSVGLGRKS
jgi:serine/threonine-protein kinase